MRKFRIKNVECQGCAKTIKNALSDEFGEICVDVGAAEISLEIDEKKLAKFREELDDLGFILEDEI